MPGSLPSGGEERERETSQEGDNDTKLERTTCASNKSLCAALIHSSGPKRLIQKAVCQKQRKKLHQLSAPNLISTLCAAREFGEQITSAAAAWVE